MEKMVKFWTGFLLTLAATLLMFQVSSQTAWALTTDLCSDCHETAEIMAPHHALPGNSCTDCHQTTVVDGAIVFLKPDCFACHDFQGGLGAASHDFHTGLIPENISACETCHTDGVPGGPLREPFGECSSCHDKFQGGPSGELHQTHTNNFGATDCNTCHGADAPACNECHQIDRHDYRNGPGAQGHDFHTGFINDCERCHVSGIAGGPLREPFGECASCHTDFQGGLNGPLHERHTNELGASDCSICHGEEAPACSQCHQVDRHDYRNGPGAQGHDFHTGFITDCERCHVSGIAGGPLREPFGECASCHKDFQNGPNGELHQRHTDDLGASDCNTCHGDNAPACNQCHEVISSDFPGQMVHDFRNGPGAQGHNFHTGFINDCERCHVSGVAGGPLREPFGECASCHTEFQNGPNGSLHQRHTNELGASDCNTCHGDNAPACNQCHQIDRHDYRDGPGAEGHDFHTGFINDCERCHVSGIAGGPLREPFGECASCHTDFQGGPSGELHQRHTNTFGASDCNTCHGDNAPACSECHQVDNHDFRNGPGAEGHNFHTGFINDCERCHVSGAPGGGPIRGPYGECSNCHRGFDGPGDSLHDRHTNRLGAGDCTICHGDRAPVCSACHQVDRHDFRSFRGDGHEFHSRFGCSRCHGGRGGRGDYGGRDGGRGDYGGGWGR